MAWHPHALCMVKTGFMQRDAEKLCNATSWACKRHMGRVPHFNPFHEINTAKKGSPYSIAKRRVPELIPLLGSQPAADTSHKPGGRLQYFPPGLQLSPQPLRGLLPILPLGEQRQEGCEQFA